MIDIKVGFDIDEKIARKYLLENNLEIKFSQKQKLYYKFFRPLIPGNLRKLIQMKIGNKINFKEDFVWEEYVNLVKSQKSKVESIYGEGNCFAIVLTHDVEEKKGFDFIPKLIEIEKKHGFVSSYNIVPYKYKIDVGIVDLIKENGNEVGIHGYNHDGKLYFSEKIFNKRAIFINEAIKKYDAVGFRSPMVHRNLYLLQKLNIEYDSSCFDYDPFQPFPGGTGSIWPFIAGKFVELPYTLPQDHTLFYVLKVKNIDIWKNKIDWIVKNNGVVLVLTHPDYLMEKNHLQHYEELLKYLKSIQNSWHSLPRELSRHFRKIIETNN